MTDLYLRREKSRKGCMGILVLLFLVLAGGVYWLKFHPRTEAQDTAPSMPEPAPSLPAVLSNDRGLLLVDEVRQLKSEDKLIEAREKAQEILSISSNAVALAEAESLLGEIHILLVFSPRAMPEKTEYTVQSGDSLAVLARRYKTTVDVLQRGNNISGQMIRAGQRLRIFSAPFSIAVSKSANTLVLSLNGKFFKRYRVGTGKYGTTPTGDFVVEDKITQPTWWRPDGKEIPYGDPENLLGTHWLKINVPGYGIHGTWEPDSVGQASSAGCIRMVNSDVEELFMLVPTGTPVTISE